MFGTRRLAKRSIVGTRVAARWQDGRFYPGVIQTQYAEETPFTDAVYTVLFEDGYEKNIPAKGIIGPGFQPTISASLKNGQKIFLTLNGREVTGVVIHHNSEIDEVTVSVMLNTGDELEISKRLEELRLLKSRKSARLQDQDTDYSKLADLQLTEPKKRTVSSGIDVPNKQSRHWHSGDADPGNLDDSEETEDVEMMDENIAAMVLTSLSCSPQSPKFDDLKELNTFSKPHTDTSIPQLSSSASSSGYYSNQSDRSDRSPGFYSNQSDRSDRSPPAVTSVLSESAPARTGMLLGPFQDEGLELEEEGKENDLSPTGKKVQRKTMYKCIWPNCGKISSTCPAIEKHVRLTHLGYNNNDSGSESDGEVDFYCTEIEVNVENVTQGFSDMCTSQSSPPTSTGSEPQINVIPDHDYQKKEFRYVAGSSVPSTSAFMGHAQAIPIPIKPAEIQRSLSWQNTTSSFSSSPSPPIRASSKPTPQERLQQHQAQSPKIHSITQPKLMSIHKKPRSEVRKCRKVYGMENRDMWCTQCKWKKACTRFLD